MKNWTILLTIAPLLYCSSSCKTLLLRMKHVRAPSLESAATVTEYLKHQGLDRYPSFVCRDSLSCYQLYDRIKSIPEAGFFNREGIMILYSDTSCPGKAGRFAAGYHPGSPSRTDTGFSLIKLEKMIGPLGESQPEPREIRDLTVVIFWAKYCGNINRNGFAILRELKERPDLKVRGVLVNMDFMKEWGMKKPPGVIMNAKGFP